MMCEARCSHRSFRRNISCRCRCQHQSMQIVHVICVCLAVNVSSSHEYLWCMCEAGKPALASTDTSLHLCTAPCLFACLLVSSTIKPFGAQEQGEADLLPTWLASMGGSVNRTITACLRLMAGVSIACREASTQFYMCLVRTPGPRYVQVQLPVLKQRSHRLSCIITSMQTLA